MSKIKQITNILLSKQVINNLVYYYVIYKFPVLGGITYKIYKILF